jgi:hypothetical protein
MSRVSSPTTVVPTREIIADFRVSPTESPQHGSEPPNPKTFLDLVKVQNVQKSIGSAVDLSVWHFLLSFQFLLAHFFLQRALLVLRIDLVLSVLDGRPTPAGCSPIVCQTPLHDLRTL